MCHSTCNAWFTSCKKDYFGFDSITGALLPCTAAANAAKLLVCSRLEELVPGGGDEMCNMEGKLILVKSFEPLLAVHC